MPASVSVRAARAREYWDGRRDAQKAGEPIPDLPHDPHNDRAVEKLGRERGAMERFLKGDDV